MLSPFIREPFFSPSRLVAASPSPARPLPTQALDIIPGSVFICQPRCRPMRLASYLFLLLILVSSACAQDQQFATIGDLKLDNGEVIRDCVVGYRVFGVLNPQKSNVVVFPTFLGGRSADLAG